MEVVLAKEGKEVGKVKRLHRSWRMSHLVSCSASHLPHEAPSIPPSKTVQISKVQFGNSGYLKKRIKRLNMFRNGRNRTIPSAFSELHLVVMEHFSC